MRMLFYRIKIIKMRDKIKTMTKFIWAICWALLELFLIFLIVGITISVLKIKNDYELWYRDCETKILQDLYNNK